MFKLNDSLKEIFFEQHFEGDPEEDKLISEKLYRNSVEKADELAETIECGISFDEIEAARRIQELILSTHFFKMMGGKING